MSQVCKKCYLSSSRPIRVPPVSSLLSISPAPPSNAAGELSAWPAKSIMFSPYTALMTVWGGRLRFLCQGPDDRGYAQMRGDLIIGGHSTSAPVKLDVSDSSAKVRDWLPSSTVRATEVRSLVCLRRADHLLCRTYLQVPLAPENSRRCAPDIVWG